MSFVGLSMIIFSYFWMDGKNNVSWTLILPTFGASMFIFFSIENESIIKNILSSKYIVFIGKISYSLYLWHGQ